MRSILMQAGKERDWHKDCQTFGFGFSNYPFILDWRVMSHDGDKKVSETKEKERKKTVYYPLGKVS